MTIATLEGNACTRARVQLPSRGVWHAEADLAGEVELSGAVVLAIGSASYAGTVVSGGVHKGRSAYRLAGGAHGWHSTVPAKSYVNDLGVRRATVVADAAEACGETADTSGLSGELGPAYVRAADMASRVLDDAAPLAWRVDADGVARFGARTATVVSTAAPRVRVDPAAGVTAIAPDPDEVALLVPGVVLDGVAVVDVQVDVDAAGLRATLYSSPWGQSRRSEAWRRIVRALVPEARWGGWHEYRVVQIESGGTRLALQPVRTVRGMPDLRYVRVRPGLAGAQCDPKLGSLVLVAFADSDPARPVVAAFDDADAPGFLPTEASLDASSTVAVGASAGSVELAGGSVPLVAPLEAGRVVRYGDTLVLTPALPAVPPLPATTNTPYLIGAGQLTAPVAVSKVTA